MVETQAEVLAEEQARLIDERLATKDDLTRLELSLTLKIGGMLAAVIAILATLVKLM